jgi:hypothetical protein
MLGLVLGNADLSWGHVLGSRASSSASNALICFSIARLTSRCGPYELATNWDSPLNSRKAHTNRTPPDPKKEVTKWAANTRRCKNATPAGVAKKAATSGSASLFSCRACQWRKVPRGIPTISINCLSLVPASASCKRLSSANFPAMIVRVYFLALPHCHS